MQYLNGVVDHCILEGIREDDHVLRLRGILPSYRGGHIPAVTREKDIGPLLRAIRNYDGVVVRSALMLAAWTALRPGVIATVDERLDEASADVTALLADGRKVHVFVEHAIGSLQRPMSDEDLERKFRGMADPILGAGRAAELIQACWRLSDVEDLAALATLMRPD